MYRRVALIGLCALILDQASKLAIVHWVMDPPRLLEVTGFFNLTLSYNRGVSFGLLASDLWFKPYLLSALAFVIVGLLLHWLRRNPARLPTLGTGLIAGGALGNVIDRLTIGAVVDFLDVHVAGWHWPAFNVADSAVTIGVALLLWDGLFAKPSKSK